MLDNTGQYSKDAGSADYKNPERNPAPSKRTNVGPALAGVLFLAALGVSAVAFKLMMVLSYID